jgi:hypothetical protein
MKARNAALLAGVAGGAAEILWVAAYGLVSPASAPEVARQVTATVFPAASSLPAAPLLGIAIHMVLSLGLGLVLAKVLLGLARGALMSAALGAAAGIWALNFLVILPAVNPAFVTLLPLAVTLGSKLLFGAALGGTLKACSMGDREGLPHAA